MARSRKVEPETAIEAAMLLFWEHGYSALSTREIEERTGLTRFTLQTSYGGKMALYLCALDSYLDAFETHVSPKMTDGKLDTIANWFEIRSQPVVLPEAARHGCMLLNALVEFSDSCAEVDARSKRFHKMMRTGFQNALGAIKEVGGVPDDFDVKARAEVLLAASIGLNITIRAARQNAAGSTMAQSVADMVRDWDH